MAEKVIKAPNSMNTVLDVDCFLVNCDADDKVIFDFTSVNFIRPVGVVSFLATLERLVKRLGEGHFQLVVENNEVAVYLRQVGVFDIMREYVNFPETQPEDVINKRSPVRPMVSCTHFRHEGHIDQLAERMEERFRTEFLGYGSLLQTCHEIFSELATNVVYHADSDGGYVLAQQYNYSTGPVVHIAVADCGIGIRASLSKNPNIGPLPSDSDAIRLALREGVTSLSDPYRGYGLSHVTYDVNKAKDREMTIRSGKGIITVQGDGTIAQREYEVYYPGTIVSVVIPCEAP